MEAPRVSKWLLRWFVWYCRGYVRRHFHSLRVSREGLGSLRAESPLVVYSNHGSWWDPLICLVLQQELLPGRTAFAPIDAAMLQRYRLFRRLGFFGVERNSRRGARVFLEQSEAILRARDSVLAITPQNGFEDVRARPIRFAPGLGHLAARGVQARFVPVAIEYVFWEERLPEVLVRFGESVEVGAEGVERLEAAEWTRRFVLELSRTQDALAAQVIRRRPEDFEVLLSGGAGQGGVYDLWRLWRARCRGQSFRKEHGNK